MERTNNDVVGEQPSYDVSGSDDGDDDDDDDDDELTESLIKRSSKWPRLTQLVFKYNNLEKIDESIVRIMYTIQYVKMMPVETSSLSGRT